MKVSPIINQLSTKLHSVNIAKTARRGLLAAAVAIPTTIATQSCCPILYGPCYNPYCVPAPVVVPVVPMPMPFVPCPCPCPPPPVPCF